MHISVYMSLDYNPHISTHYTCNMCLVKRKYAIFVFDHIKYYWENTKCIQMYPHVWTKCTSCSRHSGSSSRDRKQLLIPQLPSSKQLFHGKTHCFNGYVQVRKLLVITRGYQGYKLPTISGMSHQVLADMVGLKTIYQFQVLTQPHLYHV